MVLRETRIGSIKTGVAGLGMFIIAAALWAGTRFDDLVPDGAKVELVATGFGFTEGPAWSPEGFLLFTDLGVVNGNRVVRLNPDGTTEDFLSPSDGANGLAFDLRGNLYLCQGGVDTQGNLYGGPRQVSRISRDLQLVVLTDSFESGRFNSPNDLALDENGGVYFTDPRYGNMSDRDLNVMGVYYIDCAGETRRVISEISRPNGILLSNDATRLYVAELGFDASQLGIHMYPVLAPGRLGEGRRIHADPFVDGAGPDGMAMDELGNLYATFFEVQGFGDNQVVVMDPEGQVLGRIPVPEAPANCTFGGHDGRTLYITATTSLYRLELKVLGAPLRLDATCPSCLRAERLDEGRVRLQWTNGEVTPSGVDVFRDDGLVADGVPAEPPEYLDVAQTKDPHTYRLAFDLPGQSCPDLSARIDSIAPCDTHCEAVSAERIDGPGANVRVIVKARDNTGHTISYRLEARQGLTTVAAGPQVRSVFDLSLPAPGAWTIRATVTDDSRCEPPAQDHQCMTVFTVPPPDRSFHRGDPNSSGTTDISDGIAIFAFLFLGSPATLACRESADSNNDGTIDISDGIYLLSWLFTGGPEPVAPGPTDRPCGVDPDGIGSPGDVGCVEYPPCQ